MQRAGASVVRSVMISAVAATILMLLDFWLGHAMRGGSNESELPNARVVCNSGTVLAIGLSAFGILRDMVHLRDTSSVDSRVHRTILRRDNEVIAGGTDADSRSVG